MRPRLRRSEGRRRLEEERSWPGRFEDAAAFSHAEYCDVDSSRCFRSFLDTFHMHCTTFRHLPKNLQPAGCLLNVYRSQYHVQPKPLKCRQGGEEERGREAGGFLCAQHRKGTCRCVAVCCPIVFSHSTPGHRKFNYRNFFANRMRFLKLSGEKKKEGGETQEARGQLPGFQCNRGRLHRNAVAVLLCATSAVQDDDDAAASEPEQFFVAGRSWLPRSFLGF